MRTQSPNLTWLRSFEAAARLLNFTAAGQELGLTQTAISLHIKSLEATLGCQLFVRRARHLTLSEMGQAYLQSVSDALGSLDLATASLFGSSSLQTITVRAPISTAQLFLTPLLPQFTRTHPNISIRLISTIWARSISDHDVDVDIRQGLGNWPGLEVEKISNETIVPIAYAGAGEQAVTDPGFLDQPLINILGYEDMWSKYLSPRAVAIEQKPTLTVDTSTVAISMVAADGGRAIIQNRFAKGAIAAGTAIVIAGEPMVYAQSHYLVRGHNQKQHRPEVGLFENWVRDIFKDA